MSNCDNYDSMSDDKICLDAGQSFRLLLKGGQRPDHPLKADNGQNSRAACDQMVGPMDEVPTGDAAAGLPSGTRVSSPESSPVQDRDLRQTLTLPRSFTV